MGSIGAVDVKEVEVNAVTFTNTNDVKTITTDAGARPR